MNIAKFKVDNEKCMGCKKCLKVCPSGLIFMNKYNKAEVIDISEFGWDGCWKCEHCMVVCPVGAISVLGHYPENSIIIPNSKTTSNIMEAIICNRHSCRRYKNENVDKKVINNMISLLANAPNGGNKQQVEFTLIDDIEQMKIFSHIAYKEMERLAEIEIYPKGFDKKSYEQMKNWEKTVRPDMLFCGAPHILIPHAPLGQGTPKQDVDIAGAYFELLCASYGLGCVIMTFPLDAMENMPEVKAMLKLPKNHYMDMIIGFGYPEITYMRGTQRITDRNRIHILDFKEELL